MSSSSTQSDPNDKGPSGPFTGTCHCGRISITIPSKPAMINECRCSVCYKYGAQWGYFILKTVIITESDGASRVRYIREDMGDHEGVTLAFSHCSVCGTVTDWTGLPPSRDGDDKKLGVNMRTFGEDDKVTGGVRREVNYL